MMAEDEDTFNMSDMMSDGVSSDDDIDLSEMSLDDLLGNNRANQKKANANKLAEEESKEHNANHLEAVYDVPVQITAVLGSATMPVHKLLKLGRGAVVELEQRIGEAIDIYVNNRLIARGEVVIVGENIGITMTEILKADRG